MKVDQYPAKSDASCLAKELHALESMPVKRICTEDKTSHAWAPVNRHRVPMQTDPKDMARKGVAEGEKAPVQVTAPFATSAQAGPSVALGRSSDIRHGAAEATVLPAVRNSHSGASLDVGALRESLDRMQKEIAFCLKGLALVDGDGMGRAASSRARVVGFRVARPKSKPKPKANTSAASKSARASKGKGILGCPDQAMEWRAKVVPGERPPWAQASSVFHHGTASTQGLVAGAFTPGASSSTWAPPPDLVAVTYSLDGQQCSPVKEPSALVSVASEPDARGIGSLFSPQRRVAVSPTSNPSPGVGAKQLQGQSRLLYGSELQEEAEAVQMEGTGQRREGEMTVGSGAAGEKSSPE